MKKYLFGFLCGTLFMIIIGVSATILYNAKDIEFTPNDESWDVNNMHDAINDIKDNYIPKSKLLGKSWEFNYSEDYQYFEAPYSGTYKIELWGAQGGAGDSTYVGGLGAYTSGEIKLVNHDLLYIYVGQAGKTINSYTSMGGYNGGGGVSNINNSINSMVGTGGGATDIRLDKGNDITDSVHYSFTQNFDSLKSRIMVAAGGGGGTALVATSNVSRVNGEPGGGLLGYAGTTPYYSDGTNFIQKTSSATQISGGRGSIYTNSHANNNTVDGIFAIGGASGWYPWGGGGAGYYGGGSGGGWSGSGSGGSSFISGHDGCDAITESSTSSNIIHTGQSVHYSGLRFTNTVMIDGAGYNWTTTKESYVGQVQPDGTIAAGHSGNGYARITLVSID